MSQPFGEAPVNDHGIPRYRKATAWSYSAVTNWKNCPLKRKYNWIDKLPEPESEAQRRGGELHAVMANYVNTGRGVVDAVWKPTLDNMRNHAARTEMQQAFTVGWEPCEWFSSSAWVRMIFDSIYRDNATDTVEIDDWKTGKVSGDHIRQLRLYALGGLMLYPYAKECAARMRYVDLGPEKTVMYVAGRRAIVDLKHEFAQFAQPFLDDDIYPAKPGPLCWASKTSTYKGCPYSKTNGGPCKHG